MLEAKIDGRLGRSIDRSELPRVITPGECKIGIMQGHYSPAREHRFAIGHLTYEAVKQTQTRVGSQPAWESG